MRRNMSWTERDERIKERKVFMKDVKLMKTFILIIYILMD